MRWHNAALLIHFSIISGDKKKKEIRLARKSINQILRNMKLDAGKPVAGKCLEGCFRSCV
jgi:hypothetical protein